jgi:hypothetical protein
VTDHKPTTTAAACTRAAMAGALAAVLPSVDMLRSLELYGSLEGMAARMLESLPDLVISDPPIGACYSTKALATWTQVSRQTIVERRNRGQIFGLIYKGRLIYPAVQFDRRGQMRSQFRALMDETSGPRMSPREYTDWMHRPDPATRVTPAQALAAESVTAPAASWRPRRSDLTVIEPPAPSLTASHGAVEEVVAKAKKATIEESLTTHEVAALLGISVAVVRRRRLSNRLYAFRDEGRWRFATWQFDGDRVLPGLTAVLNGISPDLHPVIVRGVMLAKRPSFSGDSSLVRPRDWLCAGGDPARVIQVFAAQQWA